MNEETVPDYYAVLQVHPLAEREVIDAAYKKLAQKYHADSNPTENTAARMAMINEAYTVLIDAHKRVKYDARLRASRTASDTSALNCGQFQQAAPATKSTWWRWFLVLPALPFGLAVPVLVLSIVTWFFFGDWYTSSPWYMIVSSGLSGYCGVYFPSVVAPKWNRGISLISGFVAAVIGGVVLLAILMQWEGWSSVWTLISLAAMLSGAGIAVFSVWTQQ